ncbi:MAG: chromate transporter [Lachnospiraceae bacterium]|nr:chromate transporter [Lachnospiraceae bacterium]
MTYLQLFIEFFKTGLFAIGGGMATIPFLTEIAKKYPWYTTRELIDMIAVSESTPGPVGVNMATFAGYMAGGIVGALIATLSLVLPSYIIILIIARMMNKFRDNKYVEFAFTGLRPAVVALMASAALSIFMIAFLPGEQGSIMERADIKAVILFVILFLIMHVLAAPKAKKIKVHPIVYILVGAIVGIIL